MRAAWPFRAWFRLVAGIRPGTALARGRDMGCVWQSEYAPEPRLGEVRVHHRAPARHRKPPLRRRARRAFSPALAVAAARFLVRWDPGRLAPQVRLR